MNWYIYVNNQYVGPLTEENIRSRLKMGEISPNTMVWREGLTDWLLLGSSELMTSDSSLFPINTTAPKQMYGPAPDQNKNMFGYYKQVLTNYAKFSGRARRSEYWYFTLCNYLIYVGLIFTLAFTGGLIDDQDLVKLAPLYILAVFLPNLGVSIRRMHDSGKSGWFFLIPFYNFILLIREGTPGRNEYGDDPKSHQDLDLKFYSSQTT